MNKPYWNAKNLQRNKIVTLTKLGLRGLLPDEEAESKGLYPLKVGLKDDREKINELF